MKRIRHLPTLPSLLESPGRPFIHRDLSWLQFNDRVLDQARESSGNPLLERLKFLAITSSNLDEFFMIRFASLDRSIRRLNRAKGQARRGITRLTDLRDTILEHIARFGAKQSEQFDLVAQELTRVGIHIVRRLREQPALVSLGKEVFESEILPKLSHPETFDVSKVATLSNHKTAVVFPEQLWFPIPRSLRQVYLKKMGEKSYYFFLDDLLTFFLGPTFGISEKAGLIRLTRDGDFTVDIGEEDPETIPDIVLSGLGRRENGSAVRLQYRGQLSDSLLHEMGKTLRLVPGQVFTAAVSVGMHSLWSVVRSAPKQTEGPKPLRYPELANSQPVSFRSGELVFEKLREQDYLLHHPYDSFDTYIQWIKTAAADPEVVSIEQTVYRMDKVSPLIEALKSAANSGKKVRVFIELRARFDEFNNLRLADDLRKAGVEVAYGFGRLKLHAKVTLVTRKENDKTRRYTHLSTGNYNATTARIYTDLAILTSDKNLGEDARHFFDSVLEQHVPKTFKKMVTAPIKLHRRLISLIHGETRAAKKGKKTRIVAKVNALVDDQVVEALYRASKAGVKVDLIVRGACSLIPGVKGLSENIRVISVVDRFLEHSRIYYFENAGVMYLSSADWMPRNFFSRLEVAFPVLDARIYAFIRDVLIPTYFADISRARELTPQGTWKRRAARGVGDKNKTRSQFVFESLAADEYRNTPLFRTSGSSHLSSAPIK